jgi:uncharacterized protein
MSGQPVTAADPAPVAEPVALVLSRQVRAGHEQAFEEVLHRLAAAVRSQPGHLDLTVLRPAPGGPPIYTIVSHFQTGADADAWQASPQRARLIAEADLHAAGALHTRYVSGLEGWLAPRLAAWPLWARPLISAVIVIPLLQYAVMPLLTRATRGFLYPARAPRPTAGAV